MASCTDAADLFSRRATRCDPHPDLPHRGSVGALARHMTEFLPPSRTVAKKGGGVTPRLPVILLVDACEDLTLSQHSAIARFIDDFTAHLRADPFWLESASIAIITCGAQAKVLCAPTAIEAFKRPNVPAQRGRDWGVALEYLLSLIHI